MIELSKIRIDGGTQQRVSINQETVDAYAEAYAAGQPMPPVHLFYDGATFWLADGFHRLHAAKKAGLDRILEHITPGTRREAILYSLSANARHGLQRTNADKRKAVATMLDDAEWSTFSLRKIAEICGVTHPFVLTEKQKRQPLMPGDGGSSNTNDDSRVVSVTTSGDNHTAQGVVTLTTPTAVVVLPDNTNACADSSQEPDYTPLDEANDTIAALQTELALAKACGADDGADKDSVTLLISSLRDEIRILKAKLSAVTASRDQYQTENGELKKQILRQRREIDKITGSRTV